MEEFKLSMEHQLAEEMHPRYLPNEEDGVSIVYVASFTLCATIKLPEKKFKIILKYTTSPLAISPLWYKWEIDGTPSTQEDVESTISKSNSKPEMSLDYVFDADEDGYEEYELEPNDRLRNALYAMFDAKTI